MCGRTSCVLAPADIIKACSYRNYAQKRKCPSWIQAPGGQQYTPGYNLAPGAFTPVLLSAKHLVEETVSPESSYGISDRVIMPMKWGLTPPWHQGNPYKVPYETNNCRAESMMEKKSYKVPLQRGKRCVILADGFFEWKSNKDGKQPYYFYFEKEEINGLAKQNDVREEILVKCEPPEKVKESDITDNIEFKQKIKTEILRDSFLLPEKSKDPTQTIQSENEKNGESTTSSETSVFNQEFLRTHSDLDEEQQICEEQKQQNEAPLWQGYKLLTMAGVFDVWKADQSSPPLYSYSVITVSSSPDMSWCHHRMPAILSSEEEVQKWLDFSTVSLSEAVTLIKPKICLTHHAVSKQVNSSRYQALECIKPILNESKPSPECKLMQKWLQPGKKKLQETDARKYVAGSKDNQRKRRKLDGETLMMKWLKSGSSLKKN